MSETEDIERMKRDALNEFARGLAEATTVEEARGLSLIMVRSLLDIIYPSDRAPPLHQPWCREWGK